MSDQSEALRRIKEMGLFPTHLLRECERKLRSPKPATRGRPRSRSASVFLRRRGSRVKAAALAVFTRQLATLVEAGMPLLRGLRLLEEQEENHVLKSVVGELSLAIEGGSSFAEAIAMHPKVFNKLYVNMVRAGEIRGVFKDLMGGQPLPAFTRLVMGLSTAATHHLPLALTAAVLIGVVLTAIRATDFGRRRLDRLKLRMPLVGPVFRKLAISRFGRTLGTLLSSGVPILQALAIVKDTAGNVAVGDVISTVHDRGKEGDPIAPSLRTSGVFPVMVAGMVDVGEQTGALPDMLLKIADNYEEEVDNAVGAMTSLLEPIMIIALAVIVGSIVIAMFLPIIIIIGGQGGTDGPAM